MRLTAIAVAALFALVSVHASAESPLRVVATTSWTAALATAAGATDVTVLAPVELRHPAEYELKPSDIMALSGAGLIVSTGFEVMAKKLAEAAGARHVRVLQVDADYSLATMSRSLRAIAALTGTTAKAEESIRELASFLASWKGELKERGLLGAPVVVHVFQKPLMDELGFTVKGVFGPGPLEAAQIATLSASGAALIVDNWHNEVAGPLRETIPRARYVSCINFPGPDGTVSLLDVLADNRRRIDAAEE